MKLATVLLVAFVATVAAQSQGDEFESKRETGLLMGHETLFADYCVEAYNHIVQDMNKRVNERTAAIYKAFFGATTEIADEVLTVEKETVARLAEKIDSQFVAPSSADDDEGPVTEEQLQQVIEEGKEEIKSYEKMGVLGRLVSATKEATQVMMSTANSAIFVRLAKLRTGMSPSLLVDGIKGACRLTKQYEQEIGATFESTRQQLVEANKGKSEVEKFLAKVSLPTLKCFTPKTITRTSAFCDILKNAGAFFFKMLRINANKVDFSDI